MKNLLKHISINPNICHGKPCIRGHRIMVWQILDLLSSGIKPEEIISDNYFPQITLKDVYACIAYANQLVQNEEIHFFEELKSAH
ncbi:MAG TPA: antitoxin [Candidatus Omnitrophica bacterium]|nr:antitoxin [Candidatus Omnitrophota bacterium]